METQPPGSISYRTKAFVCSDINVAVGGGTGHVTCVFFRDIEDFFFSGADNERLVIVTARNMSHVRNNRNFVASNVQNRRF